MGRLSDGIFKNRPRKRNVSNATAPGNLEKNDDETDNVSISSNKSAGRLSGGLFKNRRNRKGRRKDKNDESASELFSEELKDPDQQTEKPKEDVKKADSVSSGDDSFHDTNARWSVMPDSRISGAGGKKKAAAAATMTRVQSAEGESSELYMSDDEKQLYTEDSDDEAAPKATKKKKKGGDDSAIGPSEGKVASEGKLKKKKKKKKKGDDDDDDGAIGPSEGKVASEGRLKKKKKKKKKGSAVDEVKEKVREHAEKKNKSLKDRIRASLAIISDKGGLLSNDDLNKLDLDSPKAKKKAPVGMMAITEDEEDEEEESSKEDKEEKVEAKGSDQTPEVAASSFESPVLDPKKSVVLMGSPFDHLSPVEKFKMAGKRMQDIQRMRNIAVDSKFAAVFETNARESLSKGLMSESDKETVDKLLSDLQEYEGQLEEERTALAEEREMMQLQQEAVEHLLETETMKTQELEARILELEDILENETHRQGTEDLMVKIEMLESEIERQKQTIESMEPQDGIKRKLSRSPWNMRDDSDRSDEDDAGSTGEVEENSYGGGARDSVVSISAIDNAKVQGELLKLRSSVAHKDKAIEEQAKELARLRAQLENSEEAQKLEYLEKTCEDFRNESKQFRSEVDKLKSQLSLMENIRKDNMAKMEDMKKAELENIEALKKAEEEKEEAVRQLETQNALGISVGNNPSPDQLKNILDIKSNTNSTSSLPGIADLENDEKPAVNAEDPKEEKEQQSGWFGFGGGDDKKGDKNDKSDPEQEPSNEKEKEEGFNWFGLGGNKETKEESADDEMEEADAVAELPAMQSPAETPAKEKRLSNMLDF